MYSLSLSEKQEKALSKARSYFEYADKHPVTSVFREKAIEDFSFYDGTGQWPASVLEELKERSQTPVTVNKIKNLVNYMSGVEIQTRFRTAFRSHSGKPEEDEIAQALTHLGYAIQENQDMPYKSSLKFRDALITGIGWGNIYKDNHSGEIKYEYVNPLNVLFDPDDLTPNFNNPTFVIRLRWMPLYQAEELWPEKSGYFKQMFGSNMSLDAGNYSGEIAQRQSGYVDVYASGNGDQGSRIMIVEVQYREKEKSYTGIDDSGNPFETFNKEEAYELAGGKKNVAQETATKVMRVLFTENCLLEYAPLEPTLPNLSDFTYIPCIWTRRFEDGVPDGWISVMKDIQREENYRRTKLINNLNSFRAIIDSNAFIGRDKEQIRNELKRPDAVIIKNAGSLLEIESNQSLATGQFEMLERSDKELQQVSGIYDEALGNETNATSGVAIQNRQVNSVRNQVFAFDNLRMMKKREARMLLDLIQGGGDEFLEASILTDQEFESILLNVVKVVNGKKIIFNDIRYVPLSIYVEEAPDFESSLQEQQVALENLLSNPNAAMILKSETLLKRLGVRDYQKLAEEMRQVAQEEMMNEQVADDTSQPIPANDLINNNPMQQAAS